MTAVDSAWLDRYACNETVALGLSFFLYRGVVAGGTMAPPDLGT